MVNVCRLVTSFVNDVLVGTVVAFVQLLPFIPLLYVYCVLLIVELIVNELGGNTAIAEWFERRFD